MLNLPFCAYIFHIGHKGEVICIQVVQFSFSFSGGGGGDEIFLEFGVPNVFPKVITLSHILCPQILHLLGIKVAERRRL